MGSKVIRALCNIEVKPDYLKKSFHGLAEGAGFDSNA
ncbi:hypothetical protein N473_12465 [Pseudoalteromonas luteoviolacea CPMOR-1]|uniref:Uncharacterized protein n=1 Tax=Pseudoalteromonas luteoviolacea CPMOR-1 TaxID=1365248 RepID=A0A161YT63_9GAMM|nr:hypothetical protein N473_12465 [Pseudoalteromonas luteoviolacea CPMOR-1]